MKIRCSQSQLVAGINTVVKAVPTRTSMTILECILFTADSDGIKLTANDMELGIETYIEGEVEEPGSIAVEAKIISNLVRSYSEDDFYITSGDNNKVYIECGKSKIEINGRTPEEFVLLPELDKSSPIEISQFSLKELIRQTIFSISDNDTNKIMTGELFEINEDQFKVVSLDGHRISVRNITLKNSYGHNSVIVPGKTLLELSKIIPGDVDKDVSIYLCENHVIFEYESVKVVSRIIEGNYFKIDQMISNDYETRIDVSKKELLEVIQRSTLMVKEGDKKPIVFTVKDDVATLSINSTIGSMNDDVDIEKSGKDIVIGFNPKFLIDALRVIDDENVTLYMVNPKAPCIIKNEDVSYLYLILPVNFN
ncbi:MAG: DNA polymerase III subunit beta [Lachnospiraceae bacterium]|nr:DNA polymerase III subunit beta [Lachnospiraceae bacterium]